MHWPFFTVAAALLCLITMGKATQSQETGDESTRAERISELSRRIESDPGNADLLVERAEFYQFGGRWDEMRQDAERAVDLAPRNAKARGLKGLALGLAKELGPALAELDAAVALDASNAVFWAIRGNTLLQMGRYGDAIDSLDRSIGLAPDARAYFDRAACQREKGDFAKALDDYTAALRHDPNLVAAACERAFIYQQQGDFTHAMEDLNRCQSHYPHDPQLALSMAWILATCPDDKIRDGRRALHIAGELCDPVTCEASAPLNALAAAHAELGDYAEAEMLLQRAVALSPFYRELRDASERRLAVVRQHKPIRDATTPLTLPPRIDLLVPPRITLEAAMSTPADVLASDYINTSTLLMSCPIAKAGATINSGIDGLSLKITSENAEQVEARLKERREVSKEAIRQRGHQRLSSGYVAKTNGDCDAWGLSDGRVLVEQEGCEIFITQNAIRHMGVVVESAVVMRHDANVGIRITGGLSKGVLAFTTSGHGGLDGTAKRRCRWTLEPSAVQGPDWAEAFLGRAVALGSYEKYPEALGDLETAMRLKPSDETASLLAFVLATCDDESLRNGRRAILLAERAKGIANGKPTAHVLMALAAAHAEVGDFDKAVEYQRQVIGVISDDEKPEQRERLRQFEGGSPCRLKKPYRLSW